MADSPTLMTLRLQAEGGDPRAQFILAHAYLLGLNTARDPNKALGLLDAACEQGFADALLLRGVLSMLGLFTARSDAAALDFLARAAATGDPRAQGQAAVLADGKGGFNLDVWRAKPETTQRFHAPRLFTFKRFIPKGACDWLIARSRDKLKPAAAWDDDAGSIRADDYRTSSTTSLGRLSPDLVSQLINLRIAAATGAHPLNQEPTSILHYAVGEQYRPHFDFIAGRNLEVFAEDLQHMGQRVGTFLIYLNDGYDGGETEFPLLDWRFKGEPGDAVFFWNLSPEGKPEKLSLHAGLPVVSGEKWLLSKWMRAKHVPLWWPAPHKPNA